MKKTPQCRTEVPRQPEYTGRKQFTVAHPDYGKVTVQARDKTSAIVTAAMVWATRWQKYSFYAFCDVKEG